MFKNRNKTNRKGKTERTATMAKTKVEVIHTSRPRPLLATDNRIVEIAKQTTPEAMDNTGMLPNLNIGGVASALYGPGLSALTLNG